MMNWIGISGFTYLCREISCWHLFQSWNTSGSTWGKSQPLYKQRFTNKSQLTWLTGLFDPVWWIVIPDGLIKTLREEKDTWEKNLVVVSEPQMSNRIICWPWAQLAGRIYHAHPVKIPQEFYPVCLMGMAPGLCGFVFSCLGKLWERSGRQNSTRDQFSTITWVPVLGLQHCLCYRYRKKSDHSPLFITTMVV